MTSPATPPARRLISLPSLETIRNAAIAAMIIWLPFSLLYSLQVDLHSPHMSRYIMRATLIGPLEVILIVVAVLSLPLFIRRDTYDGRPIGLIGAVALTALTLILVLATPSPEGFARVVRFAGVTGAIATIRWMSQSEFRAAVIWPLTASAAIQAVWAALQTFVWHSGHQTGITERFDHVWTQGHGSMDGAYGLATFMVLAMAIILSSGAFDQLHPMMWLSVALASASIATTFGRNGVIAALMVGGLYGLGWLVKRNWDYLASALVAVVPMGIGIVVTWAGWNVRATETAAGYQSGREALLRRALEIIRDNPLVGVGPANYGPYLAQIGLTPVDITIVHSVPVLVAAEYGVPIGLLFTLWLGLLGVAALRTSVRALAVFVSIVPYLVFAYAPLVYASGIVGFGLWLAVMDYHRRQKQVGIKRTAVTNAEAAPSIA